MKPAVIYSVLVASVFGALILLTWDGAFAPNDLGVGLFALAGTCVGALLAFRLEEYRDQKAERQRRIAA